MTRTALVEMVESSDDEILRMSLDFLRTRPCGRTGSGVVAIGAWKVNLDEHRFSAAADSTIGFQEWTGEFRLRDKRWQAVITGGRHT